MMELIIRGDGIGHCIYDESIPLTELGRLTISRASHVEPTAQGDWLADLSPMGGPTLGPFSQRTSAITAELAWLRENWLLPEP
jgi:hypothetical protein